MEIINLDMVPGKKSPVCHASQYDDGRVIRFNLYDSGLPYTLDGTETITFEVRKPDGNIVTSTLTNTSDSYVDVVTTEQMTAVKGANLCEVRVEKGATNIGSLNVIMAVEMDPTDGGIASASVIDNLRSQISGMVAEEVADQYDSANVIFDAAPTPGHGNGYAVTSEGVNNALAPKADRSELPDMTNYYDKTETDNLLDQKADTSDLPDMSNYYTKTETDTALSGKEDSITYETDDYSVATYGGIIRCKKWGRMVNIQGYSIGTSQTIPTGQALTLATIASKYRPNPQQHIMGTSNSGSYKYDNGQFYRINTDGTIIIYVYAGTTFLNGNFNVTFMV